MSASLQPYAGLADHRICEYPAAPKPVALAFVATPLQRDRNGELSAPDKPGLGVEIDRAGLKQYLLDVDIRVGGKTLYRTPEL